MLENTVCLFGSSSSAFHLSRNYPLILAGGQGMGFNQGQYHQYGLKNLDVISGQVKDDTFYKNSDIELNEEPMGRLLFTMLQQLGVEVDEFAQANTTLPEILS